MWAATGWGSRADMSDHRTTSQRPDTTADGGSLLRAGTLMAVLAILLSWLPLLGPLVAGGIGGREAGTPTRAIAVALLPAVLLAVLVGWILTAFELPVLGAIAGVGVFIAVVVQLAPLLLGAWFGASMTQGR